jgi:hypothetical protein
MALPAALLVAMLSPLPETVAAKGTDLPFVPDVERETALGLEGATWIGSGPGYGVRLTALSDAERVAFLASAAGSGTDPFATRPGQRPRFLTFLLELDNGSTQEIAFNAQNCWLVTNRNEVLYPTGLARLGQDYRMLEREMPPAYARAGSAIVESSLILLPGQRHRGLLVYPQVHPKTRSYNVELQLTLGSGEVARIVAPYRRPRKSDGEPAAN